jgi:hypothetical protein
VALNEQAPTLRIAANIAKRRSWWAAAVKLNTPSIEGFRSTNGTSFERGDEKDEDGHQSAGASATNKAYFGTDDRFDMIAAMRHRVVGAC